MATIPRLSEAEMNTVRELRSAVIQHIMQRRKANLPTNISRLTTRIKIIVISFAQINLITDMIQMEATVLFPWITRQARRAAVTINRLD